MTRYFFWCFLTLSILLVSIFFFIDGETSSCYKNQKNETYCEFLGGVETVYVNESGMRIIEFKNPIAALELKEHGIVAKSESRAIVGHGAGSDLLFSMISDAKMNDRDVKVHTHGVKDGFLYIDHVWVK